jgi:hypothetical protein
LALFFQSINPLNFESLKLSSFTHGAVEVTFIPPSKIKYLATSLGEKEDWGPRFRYLYQYLDHTFRRVLQEGRVLFDQFRACIVALFSVLIVTIFYEHSEIYKRRKSESFHP